MTQNATSKELSTVDHRLHWLSRTFKRSLSGRLYQDKRAEGNERRWAIIREKLEPQDTSLLDVGCNAGILTVRAAAAGLVALGCDVMPEAIAQAQRQYRGTAGLGFFLLEATPETVARLPTVDVVLCLSVHHYWVKAFGEDAAWGMVATLASKARRKLFFEPASRHVKYRPSVLDFVELDRASIERYNGAWLRKVCGASAAVSSLGDTPGVGKERFRVMFLVDKPAAVRVQ